MANVTNLGWWSVDLPTSATIYRNYVIRADVKANDKLLLFVFAVLCICLIDCHKDIQCFAYRPKYWPKLYMLHTAACFSPSKWSWHVEGATIASKHILMPVVSFEIGTQHEGKQPAFVQIVFVAHLVMIPLDGCSINPARSFGPAMVSRTFNHYWIFWVGTLTFQGKRSDNWSLSVRIVLASQWNPKLLPRHCVRRTLPFEFLFCIISVYQFTT